MFRMPQLTMLIFAAVIYVADSSTIHADPLPMRVMTFNIRYNNPGDGENAWPHRRDMAASMIRFHRADVIGLQEAIKEQIDDLAERLPEYSWFGVGREDGAEAGEFSPVFYRTDRLELEKHETFWLSETPGKPSVGWDAALERIVTWGRFRDRKNGTVFYLFNTHFDHRGEIARRESAALLKKHVAGIAGSFPVLVTGDFNAKPGSEPITVITTGNDPLTDTASVSHYGHHGPSGTWSGFTSPGSPGDLPIDFIFMRNNVDVLLHGTLSDTFDGRFPSDHMPVLIEIMLPEE